MDSQLFAFCRGTCCGVVGLADAPCSGARDKGALSLEYFVLPWEGSATGSGSNMQTSRM